MSVDPTALEAYREVMGDEADVFIADVINTFMTSAPKLLETMEKNINSDDRKTFVRNAHILKSNSGTVGASKLSELTAVLENEGERLDLPTLAEKLNEVKTELTGVIAFFRKVS